MSVAFLLAVCACVSQANPVVDVEKQRRILEIKRDILQIEEQLLELPESEAQDAGGYRAAGGNVRVLGGHGYKKPKAACKVEGGRANGAACGNWDQCCSGSCFPKAEGSSERVCLG